MAELVEWRSVECGDVVKLNQCDARWLTLLNVDQHWEAKLTHFDFIDVDGTHSHASRPKDEVIRRKRNGNVFDQHRDAVRRILADLDHADIHKIGA